jgi:hypothetical protein
MGGRLEKAMLKAAYIHAVTFWRDYSPKGRLLARRRARTERLLDDMARATPHRYAGTVLIDGMWDNPNFWLRLSLLRAGLGLSRGREVGIVGQHRQAQCRASFRRLGITDLRCFSVTSPSERVMRTARELIASTRTADDVLAWALPGGVHPAIMYDAILKRQRRASLDVDDANFGRDVIAALAAIECSMRILDEIQPGLLVVSHPFDFTYGSLAWLALARSTEVVLVFGLFGGLRFTRLRRPEDLFRFYDRPGREEIGELQPAQAEHLAAVGRGYLQARLAGKADDLASTYASLHNSSRIDRSAITRRHGWQESKLIVAFYASNWFDWPHQLGMTQFRDFLDWTEATFAAACANCRVNWLFKPHPAEDWFGSVSLSEILARFEGASHIAIADKSWNNADVMRAVDALVTYHGTAGVEFAALGKPVLVPDRGKYEDCGFVKVAQSRDHYIELLGSEWWHDIDLAQSTRRAEIFAGWWFCAPDWQNEFILADDAGQDALYDTIPELLLRNKFAIDREIAELARWWRSGHSYYHTYKMGRASTFRQSNIGRMRVPQS